MKKYSIVLLLTLLFTLSSIPVMAEGDEIKQNETEFKNERMEKREEIKNNKEEKREEIKTKKEEVRSAIKTKKEEVKNVREEKREMVKEKREEVKENIETRKAEREAKREAMKNEIEMRKEERQENIEERKEERQENIEERQEDRQERRADIAGDHAERLENRFNNYYNRLTSLGTKLQARIDAMEADGKDVTAAQAQLETALDSLESAYSTSQTSISEFLAVEPDEYEAQKDLALKAKETAESANTSFKTTLSELKEVVELLKESK